MREYLKDNAGRLIGCEKRGHPKGSTAVIAMSRWTLGLMWVYFLGQLPFQTILSSQVSMGTRYNLYFILLGMVIVATCETIVRKVQTLRRKAKIQRELAIG